MLARCFQSFRTGLAWRLFLIAGVAALAFSLGSALIVRGAPTSSTTYACVSRYTSQMRHVRNSTSCSSGEFLISWNSFVGDDLDANYVNEGQADSITSPMIVDGEVANADLGPDSVTTDKVLNGTINVDDLGAGSVGSDEVIDNSLTFDDLGTGSVGSDEVIDNSLTADDLGTSSVGSDEVIDNSLTASDLGTASVGSDEIADGSIIQDDLSASLESWIDGQTLEGYEIITTVSTFPGNGTLTQNLSCPSGKRVTGGGVAPSETFDMLVVASFPVSSQTWQAKVYSSAGSGVTMTTYAICVGS